MAMTEQAREVHTNTQPGSGSDQGEDQPRRCEAAQTCTKQWQQPSDGSAHERSRGDGEGNVRCAVLWLCARVALIGADLAARPPPPHTGLSGRSSCNNLCKRCSHCCATAERSARQHEEPDRISSAREAGGRDS
eukprot:2554432-Prymnesium_polylepis.2